MFLYGFYGFLMTTTQSTGSAIRNFRIDIPQADLDDLFDRLARTRFAPATPGDTWDYGMQTEYLRDLVTYWRTEFDWRAQERRINAYPQYVTEIDGQTVHFVHVVSPEPNATPIVLTHTYPGTFVDLLDMVH